MQITAADPVARAEAFLAGTGFAAFVKAAISDPYPNVLKAFRDGVYESLAFDALSCADRDAIAALVKERNQALFAVDDAASQPETFAVKTYSVIAMLPHGSASDGAIFDAFCEVDMRVENVLGGVRVRAKIHTNLSRDVVRARIERLAPDRKLLLIADL
jgi:hypothetical protein